MKIVIKYSPSCRSKPVRHSFIFGTQIKMFLIKSESYQTLHRQQHNWKVPTYRNVINTSVKQSIWHQWLNFSFAKLREYFFLHKENKNNNLVNHSSPELRLPPFYRVPKNVFDVISVVYVQGESGQMNVILRINRCLRLGESARMWYSLKYILLIFL